jgi:FtsP/CotA-like multicopper oxidase with cupredoxin domain
MVAFNAPFRLLAQLVLFSSVLAADVHYTFNIVNANLSPDGFSRPTVVVNGQFPGTLIQANKDDVLHITVNNQLTNAQMRYVSSHLDSSSPSQFLAVEAHQSIGTDWQVCFLSIDSTALNSLAFSSKREQRLKTEVRERATACELAKLIFIPLSASMVTQCPIAPGNSYTYDSKRLNFLFYCLST